MHYRGVKRDEQIKKWIAGITVNRQYHHLGEYDDAEEAALAYDQMAIELLGKWATLNFPERHNGIDRSSTAQSSTFDDRVQSTEPAMAL